MRRMIVSMVAVLGFLGCEKEDADMPEHDVAADKAAIDAVRNREAAALASGNVDSMVAVYSDDIDMMAPGMVAAKGSAALRDMINGMLKDITMSANYTSSNVEVIGDVAIDRYTAAVTVTPKAGGAATTEVIKGLHVLRRQADGSWKIVQDVWNSDAEPMAPPPPPARKG